ncbi:MAG: nucleotide exchange factor GrpE [Bdellovibrionales bacterium]
MTSDKPKQDKNRKEKLENLINQDFSSDGSEIEFEGSEEESESEDSSEQESSNVTPLSNGDGESKAKEELLYLKAEFDNYRKRAVKERSDLIKYGPEKLAVEVLNVVDIFEMALGQDVTSENLESFKEGMTMTHAQLIQALKKFGIKEIDPLGEPFDPNKHEALSNLPTNEYPEGHVAQVFKKGYIFYEKMIRPAQVLVAVPLPVEASEEEMGESIEE